MSSRLRIGVDLGGTKIEAIALDGADEVARMRVDTPRDDYAATVEAIASLVDGLEQRAGAGGSVGVGIPGTMSADSGLVKNANSVWLIGKPLKDDLQKRLAREVRIANDANCFAMSEATDGSGSDADIVFGVIVGTGVGAGIVVRGQLLTGPNGVAGEWGHNPLPWPEEDERPGSLCYCGRRGCIETFLSGPAMTGDHERHTGSRETPAQIAAAAAGGDVAANRTLRRYEDRMARALASIVNVLDPDVIVLGGGMSNIEQLYRSVPQLWTRHVFGCGAESANPRGLAPQAQRAHERVRTRLVRATHGDSSGVRGAAWLWRLE